MAGAACAAELAGNGIDVTLVDRHDYSQFQPLLYQVASSQLPAEDIARPLATMFRDRAQVTVVSGEVIAIDVGAKTVTTDAGTFGPADHLVLAAGSQANFFGVPGAAEHAFPLYTVRDAERLRRHLRDRLRELSTPGSDGALTVVVCGGGPTGVEIAGALAEMFRALRDEGRLAGPATVRLVDPGHALLAPFTDRSHRYALGKLTEMGVDVTFGVAVASVDVDSATLSDGSTVETDTVIWAGGISGASLVALTGIPTGRGGRIDVAADLTVPGHADVFAIGDVANVPDPAGGTLPQLGSVAQQSGTWAGKNIRAAPRRDRPDPVPLPRQGHHGDGRPQRRGRRGRPAPPPAGGPARVRRLARTARRAPVGLPRPRRRRHELGRRLHPPRARPRSRTRGNGRPDRMVR